MKFFQKYSLQRKQTLIVVLTSSIALLLTCVTFAAYDAFTLHRAMVQNLSTLVKIVGNNSTAALTFSDQESAAETLSALRAEPSIKAGCIYTASGEVFALYDRVDSEKEIFPKASAVDEHFFKDGTLHLFRRIEQQGEYIGTVYVESDMEALYSRLRQYLLIAAAVFLVASLVALLLSAQLQKLISGPILELVQMARAVARDKNYSLRAVKQSPDELGVLVDNFNEMLSQIQLREAELQKAKDDLEARVEMRTRDLRASEERFASAFEHAAIGMALVGIDGRWLKVNETLCNMLGYSAEELSHKTFQDITHPDDLNLDLENAKRVLEGKIRFYHMEKRYFDKRGQIIWVLLGVSLIRDAKGQPVNFISQIQDITERKRYEEVLRRTEEMYRRAISGVGAVPYSYDYKTRSYLFMGEGIEGLLGYPPHEIKASLWKEILQESVMVGEAAGLNKSEAAVRVFKGEVRNWRCDMRVLTKEGKSRWISDASVQNLDEHGNATGSMGILQDITERKETEQALLERDEKFHQLADNITDVFWIRSPDLQQLHYVSPAFERIWGRPATWLYSNPQFWVEAIFPEDRERVTSVFRTLTADAPNIEVEYRIVRPSGEIRWINSRGFQIRDAAGKLVRLTGIVTDITGRKQAEIAAMAFSKMGQSLSSAASLREASEIIGEVVEKLFGWDAFWLKLYDADRDEIYSEFTVDIVDGERVIEGRSEGRKPSDLYRGILQSGARLVLRDNPTDTLPGAVAFGNVTRPSASIMFAPIHSGGRVAGVLSVQSYKPRAYTEHDLNTFQIMADQCGGAFERIWADEARRKSESQFRLVWNSSADGMRLADRNGIVLQVNDAYCQMVGKTKQELEGAPLSIIHSPENAERILILHREQIETDSFQSHLEKEVSLWDGRKIWFELSNSILRLPEQPPLLLSIFRDVTVRKNSELKISAMHTQLLDTSRQAGMAEVATSVLHNVGNVLNSVNVSSSLIREKIKKSKVSNLCKVAMIFDEHAADLPTFFASDPRSKQLPDYLSQLSQHLVNEQQEVLKEVTSLVGNIEHIKEIVTMQQSYAKVSGVSEMLQITDLIEDALRMNAGELERNRVRIIREFSKVPPILVEKHKVLQILVNLMRNAKHALEDADADIKELRLRVERPDENILRISVIDSGIGISNENLTRIFAHGFTTRKDGHGFGLHSGALAATEMGGALIAYSEGIGKGAAFILDLPFRRS